MTLPSSGAMKLGGNVNVELGNSATAQISLGQSSVRNLYGIASGAIRLAADGYGKSSTFYLTISSNQIQVDLKTLATNAGWNGTSAVVANINSGVVIYSNNTGVAALTISGPFPNGLTLNNNGTIVGCGGSGGAGANWNNGPVNGGNGSSGGPALNLLSNITINNAGIIGGGGGGGGGGASRGYIYPGLLIGCGGGGGGGGQTGLTNSSGGSGGSGGGTTPRPGGAGGSGTSSSAGGGGGGGSYPNVLTYAGNGGSGGSLGTSGAGGGAGSGGNTGGASGGSGGAAGKAINLNGYTISYTAVGTIYGAVS